MSDSPDLYTLVCNYLQVREIPEPEFSAHVKSNQHIIDMGADLHQFATYVGLDIRRTRALRSKNALVASGLDRIVKDMQSLKVRISKK